MLNKCYKKHKGKFLKEARKSHQNRSEEEQDRRRRNVQHRYQKLPEEQKQKLLEYMKKYYLALFGHFKDPRAVKYVLRINP